MMKLKRRELAILTDEQLQNCIISEIEVEIYMLNELDHTGRIIGYSESSIQTEVGRYLREICEIKTKQNYLKLL